MNCNLTKAANKTRILFDRYTLVNRSISSSVWK